MTLWDSHFKSRTFKDSSWLTTPNIDGRDLNSTLGGVGNIERCFGHLVFPPLRLLPESPHSNGFFLLVIGHRWMAMVFSVSIHDDIVCGQTRLDIGWIQWNVRPLIHTPSTGFVDGFPYLRHILFKMSVIKQ